MDEEKREIPLPSDEEINRQVACIVRMGLPKKQRFFYTLLEMGSLIGWRYIVLNRNERVFSGFLFVIILGYFMLSNYEQTVQLSPFYGMLFILSPLLFLGLTAYAYYERYSHNTFELEMTMKYTVFQLITFRMLFFSCLAVLVNMSLILLLSLSVEIDVVRAILVSITGLFMFSAGLLFALRKGSVFKRGMLFVGVWIVINALLIVYLDHHYASLLHKIPIIIYTVILLGCFCLYVYSLKYLFNRKQEEVMAC